MSWKHVWMTAAALTLAFLGGGFVGAWGTHRVLMAGVPDFLDAQIGVVQRDMKLLMLAEAEGPDEGHSELVNWIVWKTQMDALTLAAAVDGSQAQQGEDRIDALFGKLENSRLLKEDESKLGTSATLVWQCMLERSRADSPQVGACKTAIQAAMPGTPQRS